MTAATTAAQRHLLGVGKPPLSGLLLKPARLHCRLFGQTQLWPYVGIRLTHAAVTTAKEKVLSGLQQTAYARVERAAASKLRSPTRPKERGSCVPPPGMSAE